MVASTCEHPNETITLRGRSFQVCDHPAVVAEARVFAHEFELWHQRFFDAVLPGCDRFVDCGAYMGFSALYAAACGVDVTAFEPSRMNFQLLSLNVDMNPDLASHIGIYSHGLGARDENVTLYAHHFADREASVFPVVERDDMVTALPEATVELLFPNGTVITPDGKKLIVAETIGQALTIFDIAEDGSLENRGVFAQMPEMFPDGICLDAEGAVWFANPRKGYVARVFEGGDIEHRIDLEPGRGAFACMLGGSDGRTLFICSCTGSGPAAASKTDGRIETIRVEVPRAGWP